jgi:hypothetical protein
LGLFIQLSRKILGRRITDCFLVKQFVRLVRISRGAGATRRCGCRRSLKLRLPLKFLRGFIRLIDDRLQLVSAALVLGHGGVHLLLRVLQVFDEAGCVSLDAIKTSAPPPTPPFHRRLTLQSWRQHRVGKQCRRWDDLRSRTE